MSTLVLKSKMLFGKCFDYLQTSWPKNDVSDSLGFEIL